MRKHLLHFLFFGLLTICYAATTVAQTTVRGKVVDSDSNEPLIGASVQVNGTDQGTVTDLDGLFLIKVSSSDFTLTFKYIGYKEVKKKITQKGTTDLGIIGMIPDAVTLNDVIVTSSVAIARKTPVAMSTIDPVFINEKLGTQEFPEILKTTPGVYPTKKSGGFGDSEIRMRGFKNENIAVMVNGVPMNDMEWGGIYWSNWAGLSDVTRSMQTQRGLGASKLSVPSVGGSINIVTRSIDAQKGGSISYMMGNDGYNKILFNVSTGLTKSGWALTLLGSKTWGNGYVQGTDFEGYNYFVNLSKRINENHQISFTAFGAPQWHYQRNSNDGLSIEEWQKVKNYMNGASPYRYNPTYGFGLHGERKSSAYNKFHKPQLSLNYLWQIDRKSSLSTVLYASIGRGYGYSGQGYGKDAQGNTYRNKWYGAYRGKLNTYYRNIDGTFAYDQIYEENAASDNGSMMAMSLSKNYHNWYGLISTYSTTFAEKINFYAGIDFRYYKGTHTNELNDLYGGKYFIDESRANVNAADNFLAANPSYKYQKLQVGDVVYRNFNGYVVQEGAFAQAEYNGDKLSAFIAGSLSNTGYWRYDHFYYDKEHAKSQTVNFIGFTVKGGLNYNITENHNIFANIGYISRAPFFSGGAFLQSTTSNETNPDAINENIFSAELGYGFRSTFFTANLNVYHTKWMNKTMARSMSITGDNNVIKDRATINMSGVNATHQGIELDLVAKPFTWLDLTGMFSIGNWRWDSDPTGYFYNSLGQPLKNLNGEIASGIQSADHAYAKMNLKGVKVGGSAQTTAAAGFIVKPLKGLSVGADFVYYGRNYADWSFSTNDLKENAVIDFENPWRIPSAGIVDLNASYRFNIGKIEAILSGNVNNLFNQEYITDAIDGSKHDWKTAYGVFYGFERNYSVRLRLNF